MEAIFNHVLAQYIVLYVRGAIKRQISEKPSCLRAFGGDVNGVLASFERVSDLFLDLSISLFR